MLKNKKAMLANIIGGFIVIMIGVSLIGPIAQEMSNLATCQEGSSSVLGIATTITNNNSPEGSTDSFGGGGSTHFGGYDGEVKHKSFIQTVADTSIVKTNKSILNPNCTPLTGASAVILQSVPILFVIAISMVGLAMAYNAIRNAGFLGGDDI